MELTITKTNFEQEVTASSVPVLLDFWAAWCGPCRMVAPVVEELAGAYDGKLTVGKVNVDEEQELSAEFQITSIPTLILFKDGKAVDTVIGYRSKEQLEEMIAAHL